MPADPNRVILTGENPFIRLSVNDGDPLTTNASFWRIISCPAGPGHVLYLNSELTGSRWRIYADNIEMARWLQSTVQGMLNPETADASIPVIDAEFTKSGDPRYFWTERIVARDDDLVSDRRTIADPHSTKCGTGASLRGVHSSDPRARRAADAERRRSSRPAVAEGTRRAALQHLRLGVFRELDAGAIRFRPCPCAPRPHCGERRSFSTSPSKEVDEL